MDSSIHPFDPFIADDDPSLKRHRKTAEKPESDEHDEPKKAVAHKPAEHAAHPDKPKERSSRAAS